MTQAHFKRLLEARIVVQDAWCAELLEPFADATGRPAHPADEICANSPLVFVGDSKPPPRLIANTLWMHATVAGVDRLLLENKWPDRMLLTRTVGSMPDRIAEYVACRVLMDAQRVHRLDEAQRLGRWRPVTPLSIQGRIAVVAGVGEIGSAIGRMLKALGVRVIGVATHARSQAGPFERILDRSSAMSGLDCSWLIMALPLTRRTVCFLDGPLLDAMGACYVVNVGRGATVDVRALLKRIRNGSIRGATTDVLQTEPLPTGSPLWRTPGFTITPHIAGKTLSSDVVADFTACWSQLRAGRLPARIVDIKREY